MLWVLQILAVTFWRINFEYISTYYDSIIFIVRVEVDHSLSEFEFRQQITFDKYFADALQYSDPIQAFLSFDNIY